MAQGMAAVLRQMTQLKAIEGNFTKRFSHPKFWLLLSLLGGIVCIMGNFLLMDSLQKYIHVPRET